MNKEHIPVITDREELYDKCENMEQLYDKYYLPLLDVHYRKTYELQQENKQLKDNWDKLKNFITKEYYMYLPFAASTKSITILIDKMKELEGSDSNE